MTSELPTKIIVALPAAGLLYFYSGGWSPDWYDPAIRLISLLLFLLNAAVRISIHDYWLWTVQHLIMAGVMIGIITNGASSNSFVDSCLLYAAAISLYASATQSIRFDKANRNVEAAGRYE